MSNSRCNTIWLAGDQPAQQMSPSWQFMEDRARYSVRLWKKDVPVRKTSAGATYDLQQLKILIVSTPKTGNTWLKHLLSAIYDLPKVEFGVTFDAAAADQLGPRWVGHQHYYPDSALLDWAARKNVVLLTTVRHPADVLISLYHHVRNYYTSNNSDYGVEAVLMRNGDRPDEEKLAAFVEQFFYVQLNASIAWMYTGCSQVIRYEDLWRDPLATLTRLTTSIYPVSLDCLERAIEQCDIGLLRRVTDSERMFFRRGGIGGWRQELSPAIVDLFGRLDPYPAQFAALEYSLDPNDPLFDAPAIPVATSNPFRQISHFDNGVPVPAIAAQLYLTFDSAEARRRWPDVSNTQSPDSFYAWLNAPDEHDPQRNAAPLITNLGGYLYRMRHSASYTLPDVYGRHRPDWALWMLTEAAKEYNLDPAFILPVRESFLTWARDVYPKDPARSSATPPIVNFAFLIYHMRADVRSTYPDLFGRDRVQFLIWLIKNGISEHKLDPAFFAPVHERFLAWANEPDPGDPQRRQPVPLITRLAAQVYRDRPDLHKLFPDLYGKDRLDYLTWFIHHHSGVAGLVRAIVGSWAHGYRRKQLDSSAASR